MDIYEALNGRRSIRKYRSAKIENEKLIKLAQAAITAPSNGNSQPWDFIFVTDTELINQLCKILEEVHHEYFGKGRKDNLEGEILKEKVSSYGRMANVPVFLVVCMNIKNQQLNKPYEDWTTKWAHHSIAAAMQNLMLAAFAEGLGTCWLGTPGWQNEKIKSLLNIPDKTDIFAMSPIGYPDESPKSRPRMPVEEVTHFNKWSVQKN
ncbi:MAG: nitroreductase family protein [Treponema sp.]|nr:nitroreductase family protein [Treponema sp.]